MVSIFASRSIKLQNAGVFATSVKGRFAGGVCANEHKQNKSSKINVACCPTWLRKKWQPDFMRNEPSERQHSPCGSCPSPVWPRHDSPSVTVRESPCTISSECI